MQSSSDTKRETHLADDVTHNSGVTFTFRGRTGALVRASDFGPRGPWFEPRPVRRSLWP